MDTKTLHIVSLLPEKSKVSVPWPVLGKSPGYPPPPCNSLLVFELNLTPTSPWIHNFLQMLNSRGLVFVERARAEEKTLYLELLPKMMEWILTIHEEKFRMNLRDAIFIANKTRPSSEEEVQLLAAADQAKFEARLQEISNKFINFGKPIPKQSLEEMSL